MLLNKEFFRVSRAKATLMVQLDTLQESLDLSDIEMLQALNEWQSLKLRYMLRVERHGDDQKEADCDFGNAAEGNTCFDKKFE